MPLAAGNRLTAARLNAIGRMVGQTTWTTDSATFTTSEVMVQTLTFTASTGIYYWVLVDAGWTCTSLGTATWRIRAAGGASVTTGGASKYVRKRRIHTLGSYDFLEVKSIAFADVTPSSGQITVGLSGSTDTGTGKLIAASDNVGWMGVFAVGLS